MARMLIRLPLCVVLRLRPLFLPFDLFYKRGGSGVSRPRHRIESVGIAGSTFLVHYMLGDMDVGTWSRYQPARVTVGLVYMLGGVASLEPFR
ncbi:hypothetical protein P171DRAFT_432147 [Karstenula rhodostoma CBS 690.94]|uniref:Uncharacterized protein n=1 Tax=Karstenula rhodostoma CBS 690.94 TaxID=1392251 RepID=A0A9P4PJ15_9PLEO|nr:hypothetical protein P171DRAFT_432147 [Karstenula rhodostoma CBS 690.94]